MNRISNICFLCDQPARPLNGNGSFNMKSNIFQKLNIKINNPEADVMDVMCWNCTVILDEIDTLRNEMNLLLYLVHRQIKRKYKITGRLYEQQPNVEQLNKLDLIAVKSFKLLSNIYVCVKCSFKTPFQDALVPHFKFHAICDKSQISATFDDDNTVDCENDLIEYDSDYEDELNDDREEDNALVVCNEQVDDEPIDAVKYTELIPPELETNKHLEFMCPLCLFKDYEYDNIAKHISEMHPDGEFSKQKFNSCPNCGCLLVANTPCTHEKAIEKGFKPKNCSKCNETFYMDHLLQDHFRRVHLKCDICDKTFSNYKALRQHEYAHKDGALYKCPDCDKIFKTRSGLIYHLPKHTGNYLCYCNVCGKGFMSEKFLEEHMGIHTKVHKYVCDVCGTKFIHNSTYRLHRLWHDNPYPYECNDCGRKFKHTSILKVHQRREHTGERPYKCDVCHKAFFESTSLRTHQRVHAQVVAYKCHSCNVSFNSKLDHVLHMQQNHSRGPNLPQKRVCQYKMSLQPKYLAAHQKVEVVQTCKLSDTSDTEISYKDRLIEGISSVDSNLDDSFIYKILL